MAEVGMNYRMRHARTLAQSMIYFEHLARQSEQHGDQQGARQAWFDRDRVALRRSMLLLHIPRWGMRR